MTHSENSSQKTNEPALVDLFRPLIRYRRLIWQGTVGATLIAAFLGALYLFFQPTAWSAALNFSPLFAGADVNRYPNGLPFSTTDITDASVVSQVFSKNGIQNYCSLNNFRAGLIVLNTSPALQFLVLEYEARLGDPRLSSIDRQRLQDEFVIRRASLTREYQLRFIRPAECISVPQPVILKALEEVLEVWAIDAQERRGVLQVRLAMLTPAVFDQPSSFNGSLLVRADLVRAAIERVIINISEAERMQGSELVRIGEPRVGLSEVRLRLEDLKQAQLDPLIGMAGRGLGRESEQWVNQAIETAASQLRVTETKAEAYRLALREYSGVPSAPSGAGAGGAGGGEKPQAPSDVQALTPQIDRTFIEGIVDLSAANTEFRQEITRKMMDAAVAVANRREVVEYYRGLLAAMKQSGGEQLSTPEVAKRLAAITEQAKETTRLFNQIYDEYSRVSFRPVAEIYRIQQPVQVTVLRAFTLRSFAILLLGVFLAAPIVLAVTCLVLFHVRRFVMSALPATA